MSSHYLLEYERKKDMLKCVISCIISTDLSNAGHIDSADAGEEVKLLKTCSHNATSLPWIKSEEIDEIISMWEDDVDQSVIDTKAGKHLNSSI